MDYLHQETCKIHARKLDKENFRISPTKLSKQELEEHYYSLVETNEELKKTINAQNETLKLQSTKLLRMSSAQKRHLCRTPTKCCSNAHEIIEANNATIKELEDKVLRMSGKIRILNMRLCTHKQFTKSSPSRTSSKFRIFSASTSVKNIEIMESERDSNLASNSSVETAQSHKDCVSNDSDEMKTVIVNENIKEETEIDQNKWKNEISGLQEIINNLRKELSQCQEANRSLEEQARSLATRVALTQDEKSRARRTSDERTHQVDMITSQLRETRSALSSVTAELAIEKKKVLELHMQLKAASTSKEAVEMLEQHLLQITERENSKYETSKGLLSRNIDELLKLESENDVKISSNEDSIKKKCNDGDIDEIEQYRNDKQSENVKLLMNKINILQKELDSFTVSKAAKQSKDNAETSDIGVNTENSIETKNSVTSLDVRPTKIKMLPSNAIVQTEKPKLVDAIIQTTQELQSPRHLSLSNKTYTVREDDCKNSVPSNDTEQDIASITDASEKDRESFSMDKSLTSKTEDTTEYSSNSDSADTTINIFSDGEIPVYFYKRRQSSASIKTRLNSAVNPKSMSRPSSTRERMEETLKAIGSELNKCQALLCQHTPKPM